MIAYDILAFGGIFASVIPDLVSPTLAEAIFLVSDLVTEDDASTGKDGWNMGNMRWHRPRHWTEADIALVCCSFTGG